MDVEHFILGISLFLVFSMTTPWEDWAEEWLPPWEDWYSYHPAQPPVLTRRQYSLCLVIQRAFIVSLIQDLGADFRVAVQFTIPHRHRIRRRPLRDILLSNKIIRIIGLPLTEEVWTEIIRWGRRSLPHGPFLSSGIRAPLFRPR